MWRSTVVPFFFLCLSWVAGLCLENSTRSQTNTGPGLRMQCTGSDVPSADSGQKETHEKQQTCSVDPPSIPHALAAACSPLCSSTWCLRSRPLRFNVKLNWSAIAQRHVLSRRFARQAALYFPLDLELLHVASLVPFVVSKWRASGAVCFIAVCKNVPSSSTWARPFQTPTVSKQLLNLGVLFTSATRLWECVLR